MILTCPSCSAQFMVSSEALGPNGRTVRCSKCANSWFQASQRDSLDDLPRDIPEVAVEVPPKLERKPKREEIDIDFAPPKIDVALERSPLKFTKRNVAVSGGAAFAAALIVFGVFALMKPSLSKNEFFAKAYNSFGFNVAAEPASLEFDRIIAVRNEAGISVSGQLINMGAKPVNIREAKALLLDEKGKLIAEQAAQIPQTIPAEQSEKISAEYKNASPDAASVKLQIQP